jgi:hypothetical protein
MNPEALTPLMSDADESTFCVAIRAAPDFRDFLLELRGAPLDAMEILDIFGDSSL